MYPVSGMPRLEEDISCPSYILFHLTYCLEEGSLIELEAHHVNEAGWPRASRLLYLPPPTHTHLPSAGVTGTMS